MQILVHVAVLWMQVDLFGAMVVHEAHPCFVSPTTHVEILHVNEYRNDQMAILHHLDFPFWIRANISQGIVSGPSRWKHCIGEHEFLPAKLIDVCVDVKIQLVPTVST